MGESFGRDGHRMIVEVPVFTVSNVSDVSDELSLDRTSVGVKDKGRLSQLLCVVLSV